MSFVLQIWELPQGREWPKTIKEATALVSGLHGQYPGQNPKFIVRATADGALPVHHVAGS